MTKLRVLHGLDCFNIGGIQEQILLLGKYSQHHHDAWGYKGTMTPYMDAVGITTWEGGPPEDSHYDVYVGHGVGGWSYNNSFDWAHARGMKTVEIMHSQAASQTDPSKCDGFIAISDRALSYNRHMTKASRIYGMCVVASFSVAHGEAIGRLSRLADEKRPQDFVDIASAFRGEKFLMAGDGQMFRQLQESAPMNLEMVGWVRDFPEFYSRLKLFVFPTRDETCSMSVAMAQAAGLPCIVQDIPALRETTGGHATFANGISEFCAQARHFLDAPQDFDDIAKASRDWAMANFDVPVTVGAWDSYLEGLL